MLHLGSSCLLKKWRNLLRFRQLYTGFIITKDTGGQLKMNVWIVLAKIKFRTITLSSRHAGRQMGKLLVTFPWEFRDLLSFR